MFKFIKEIFKKEEEVVGFQDTYMGRLVMERLRLAERVKLVEDDDLMELLLQQINTIGLEMDIVRKLEEKGVKLL